MPAPRALASPASLKGVLAARDAAAALEDGFVHVGIECDQLPLADGGEGTLAVLTAATLRLIALSSARRTRTVA